MASVVYTERIPESVRVGGMINYCGAAGVITDAQVAANATITLLKAAILAAANVQQQPLAIMLNKALDRGVTIGCITATHGQTTVAGLRGMTDASATMKQGFFS